MIRFLIFVILAYVAYRVVKAVFWPKEKTIRGPEGGVIDEMVQDPYCKTYVPKREAVKKTIGGETFSFCSEACAAKFESEKGA
jgi:YHS domain-containing protein